MGKVVINPPDTPPFFRYRGDPDSRPNCAPTRKKLGFETGTSEARRQPSDGVLTAKKSAGVCNPNGLDLSRTIDRRRHGGLDDEHHEKAPVEHYEVAPVAEPPTKKAAAALQTPKQRPGQQREAAPATPKNPTLLGQGVEEAYQFMLSALEQFTGPEMPSRPKKKENATELAKHPFAKGNATTPFVSGLTKIDGPSKAAPVNQTARGASTGATGRGTTPGTPRGAPTGASMQGAMPLSARGAPAGANGPTADGASGLGSAPGTQGSVSGPRAPGPPTSEESASQFFIGRPLFSNLGGLTPPAPNPSQFSSRLPSASAPGDYPFCPQPEEKLGLTPPPGFSNLLSPAPMIPAGCPWMNPPVTGSSSRWVAEEQPTQSDNQNARDLWAAYNRPPSLESAWNVQKPLRQFASDTSGAGAATASAPSMPLGHMSGPTPPPNPFLTPQPTSLLPPPVQCWPPSVDQHSHSFHRVARDTQSQTFSYQPSSQPLAGTPRGGQERTPRNSSMPARKSSGNKDGRRTPDPSRIAHALSQALQNAVPVTPHQQSFSASKPLWQTDMQSVVPPAPLGDSCQPLSAVELMLGQHPPSYAAPASAADLNGSLRGLSQNTFIRCPSGYSVKHARSTSAVPGMSVSGSYQGSSVTVPAYASVQPPTSRSCTPTARSFAAPSRSCTPTGRSFAAPPPQSNSAAWPLTPRAASSSFRQEVPRSASCRTRSVTPSRRVLSTSAAPGTPGTLAVAIGTNTPRTPGLSFRQPSTQVTAIPPSSARTEMTPPRSLFEQSGPMHKHGASSVGTPSASACFAVRHCNPVAPEMDTFLNGNFSAGSERRGWMFDGIRS